MAESVNGLTGRYPDLEGRASFGREVGTDLAWKLGIMEKKRRSLKKLGVVETMAVKKGFCG